MHANGNQIMEGKVLDEQVKIRIFEAFWKSHATLTLLATQDCPLWLQYD